VGAEEEGEEDEEEEVVVVVHLVPPTAVAHGEEAGKPAWCVVHVGVWCIVWCM
jgi:hypothetical protein